MDYSKHVSTKATPQMQPTLGKNEVVNAAGGYVFAVSPWNCLDRFLILGSEGGTYYVGEQKLTVENAQTIHKLIGEDGLRVVSRVVEISDSGRAPKNDPALFVLAMAAKLGNDATRAAALSVLPKVARIGTHLHHFAQFLAGFGGFGRGTKRAFANWYNDKPLDKLVYQVTKYASRDGWSHRDLLRLSHPVAPSEDYNELYKWIVDGELKENCADHMLPIRAIEELKHFTEAKDVVNYIQEYSLPREVIPTQFLNSSEVWNALLEKMGVEATCRNLGKMTAVGLLTPMSNAVRTVVARLNDEEALKAARLHPIKVLAALMTYRSGHGVRGSNAWDPVGQIVDALDSAFYKTFSTVEPTGKRIMLALDVSGSMTMDDIAGVPGLNPRVASAALALVTAAVEPNHVIGGFTAMSGRSSRGYAGAYDYKGTSDPDTGFATLAISPRQRLDDVTKYIAGLTMGATDCSLPMLWALKHKVPVDAFVVFSDNESWAGDIKPFQALEMYRQKTGIPAKAIAVGMTATKYSVFDENDKACLNVVGFDTATPSLISDFTAND